MSEGQKKQLEELIAQAVTVLSSNEDSGLKEHKDEAESLLSTEAPTSADAAELISELTSHLSVYTQAESKEGGQSSGSERGQGGSGGGGR